MGYFSKLAAERAERENTDKCYSSAKTQLGWRIQELQDRLRELMKSSNNKSLCFQNETGRRFSGEALRRLRPEDLCTADEVLRAIDQAKQQLAILEGQNYACFSDMIPGQMLISEIPAHAEQGEKEV